MLAVSQEGPMSRQHPAPEPTRRPTNVSLPEPLVEEAKALGVNLSRACETGLAAAVKAERERRWLAENREALESWNEYVEKHGLPLAEYRQF
jgi:antitoxin CcdA